MILSPHHAALSSNSLVAGLHTMDNVPASFDGTLDTALVVNREVLG